MNKGAIRKPKPIISCNSGSLIIYNWVQIYTIINKSFWVIGANTGYMNLNKILWGLQDGCKFRTLCYPDLYILVVSPNIVLISSFFFSSNRLFRHCPVLLPHLQFCLLKTAAFSKITKSCQTLAHRLWTLRQKLKQNFNYTLGNKPTIKAMEFHGRIKYLPYHSNSQGCATKAVASVPCPLASNSQPWEPVRSKRLGRLGKAPGPVTWGALCLTAADRAEAALGNLLLADDFNEEKNMTPSQYFLNFRSESTRYSFYQDTAFSSPELCADKIFNTLPLIKGLVYKHLLP